MRGSAQQPSATLSRYRIRAGVSQRGLAKLAGVPPSTVREAEHGSVPVPATQAKIARTLSHELGEAITVFDLWPLIESGKVA